MAGAYARLTGKLGVCIASNGPGVANMLSGVAVENGEGNRVLLLTSSRRTGIAYPDRGGAYQCFDQVDVIRGMSKWSQTATSFARIPELLALPELEQPEPVEAELVVPEPEALAEAAAAEPEQEAEPELHPAQLGLF